LQEHAAVASVTVFLTSGSGTWLVPTNFGNLISVECIGGGAGGSRNTGIPALASGGGGSAYAKITSTTTPLVPGSTLIGYVVGTGGAAQTASSAAGFDGGATVWNASSLADAVSKGSAVAVGADPGKGGSGTAGLGGLASASVGTTKFNGGNGQSGNLNNCGGGGAGGPNGAGGAAALGVGGSADGGTVPGGAAGSPGNSGTEWDATHGCGSGAGSQHFSSTTGQPGGNYGGGGNGAAGTSVPSSGAGGGGLIIIVYEKSISGEYELTGSDSSFTSFVPVAVGLYTLSGRTITFSAPTGQHVNLDHGAFALTTVPAGGGLPGGGGQGGGDFINTSPISSANVLGPLPPLTARWVNDPDGSPAQIWRQYLLSFDSQMRAVMTGNFGVLKSATDDLSAAAAGVKLGGLYQSGGAVRIRLT
jgi:hypothetical protein